MVFSKTSVKEQIDKITDAVVVFVTGSINNLKTELDLKIGGRIVDLENRVKALEDEKGVRK